MMIGKSPGGNFYQIGVDNLEDTKKTARVLRRAGHHGIQDSMSIYDDMGTGHVLAFETLAPEGPQKRIRTFEFSMYGATSEVF